MQVNEMEIYEVTLTAVKCTHRIKYGTRCFQLFFDIPSLGESTSRTVGIPKTLKPANNAFTEVLGPILEKEYPEHMLGRPDLLAKELDKDLANQTYYARLSKSSNGKYINIDAVNKVGAG